jgi:hypothetical protein
VAGAANTLSLSLALNKVAACFETSDPAAAERMLHTWPIRFTFVPPSGDSISSVAMLQSLRPERWSISRHVS